RLAAARPFAGQGAGDCLTTVTMLPDTISSPTARPGIPKIASASGEPFASATSVKRRTPPASTGTLTTNLQRWLSIGSAVILMLATSIAHRFRRGHHVLQRRDRLVPSSRFQAAIGIHPDLRVLEHARHALQCRR